MLVKKKDGFWHMYINYRALNKISIKDRYPIPVIDELLDELHSTLVFSKLNLCLRYH